MNYQPLFTDPQLKKWKTLFRVSFVVNLLLLAFIIFYKFPGSEEKKPENKSASAEQVSATAEAASGSAQTEASSQAANGDQPAAATPAPAPSQTPNRTYTAGEPIASSVVISDNFYNAFNHSEEIQKMSQALNTAKLADILSAHIARLLIWDVSLRSDARKEDTIDFVFRIIPTDEKKQRNDLPDDLEILAVKYYSHKLSKTISIYKYTAKDSSSRYYYSDGTMIEKKITPNPPIKNYIQITSTIGDRAPKHEGIDFKAPVGTPVYSTVNGRVARINWKTKYNGYCIEIEEKGKPFVFKYLHLSEVLVDAGQSVTAGQHIANSGNTGKSTAPHLHYQINIGQKGKVQDPFVFHKTTVTSVPAAELTEFKNKVAELDTLMD